MDEVTKTYLTNERYHAESKIQKLHNRINVLTELLDDEGKLRTEPVEEDTPEDKASPTMAFLYGSALDGEFFVSRDTDLSSYAGFIRSVFGQTGPYVRLSADDMWIILEKLEGTLGRNKKAVADNLHKMARHGTLRREKRGTRGTFFSGNS